MYQTQEGIRGDVKKMKEKVKKEKVKKISIPESELELLHSRLIYARTCIEQMEIGVLDDPERTKYALKDLDQSIEWIEKYYTSK